MNNIQAVPNHRRITLKILEWIAYATAFILALSITPSMYQKIKPLVPVPTTLELSTSAIPVATDTIYAEPVRLEIPAIDVDTKVIPVGGGQTGAVDVPSGRNDVGWWKLGSVPGNRGTALLAGHSGWRGNLTAAFDNLGRLRPGDVIYITDKNNHRIPFTVLKKQEYKPKTKLQNVFKDSGSGKHVALVTCSGTWNDLWGTHTRRLVVFADLLQK